MSSKQHSRRTLLKSLAAGTVAVGLGAALPGAAGAAPALAAAAAPSGGRNRLVPLNRLGLQLFSVRDKLSGAGSIGFRNLFEALSDIGFSQVEFAGYTQGGAGAISIPEIRTLLDDFGLKAAGSHVTLNANNIDAQLENARILGMPYLGQGGAIAQGRTQAAWLTAINNWNAWGEKAKALGIKLYTHTHNGEWNWTTDANGAVTDKRVYDLLLEQTNPETIFIEMDIYWAHVGIFQYPGPKKPLDYILANPRRFDMVHLKDGKRNAASANGYDIIEFGAGDIDYAAFLSATRDRGQRLGMWEQDNAGSTAAFGNPVNSLGNAERSYNAIAALRG